MNSITERSHEARHAMRHQLAAIDAPRRAAPPAPAEHRPAPGAVIRAAFASVGELQAAADEQEFSSRLGEIDRARLDDMARQGYLDGHDRGHQEGYQEGLARAVEDVTARLGGALAALTEAARRLAAADAATLAELDAHVTGFALDVAEQVIGHELAAAADPGRDALARAIALAPDRGEVVARLNPHDVDGLGSVEGLAPGREVTIVADAGVQPGGCVLDVGACRVDAQLGPALDRVRRVLGR